MGDTVNGRTEKVISSEDGIRKTVNWEETEGHIGMIPKENILCREVR